MSLNSILKRVERTVQSNSPAILAGIGVSGTISTAYLAAKAGYEIGGWNYQFQELPKKEKIKACWKKYIPAGISGAITIGCVVSATRIGHKRAAAAYSLLTVAERSFTEYKEKVVEQLGEKKEQAIRDEIAQDRVNNNPPKDVIVMGTGNVLCQETHTGRYFNCDMETLRKAENKINHQLISQNEANLNDFYYLVGLEPTSFSSVTGWNVDRQLELRFSTALTPDGRPCITFDYNYIIPF